MKEFKKILSDTAHKKITEMADMYDNFDAFVLSIENAHNSVIKLKKENANLRNRLAILETRQNESKTVEFDVPTYSKQVATDTENENENEPEEDEPFLVKYSVLIYALAFVFLLSFFAVWFFSPTATSESVQKPKIDTVQNLSIEKRANALVLKMQSFQNLQSPPPTDY
jgi:hypothetical protein